MPGRSAIRFRTATDWRLSESDCSRRVGRGGARYMEHHPVELNRKRPPNQRNVVDVRGLKFLMLR